MAMTRRNFLTGATAAAGGLLLGACSDNSSSSSTTTTRPSTTTSGRGTTTTVPQTTTTARVLLPGERPDPSKPEGTDTIPEIASVVIVMMENHSYDNYLGVLGRGDGLTLDADGHPTNANAGLDGVPVQAFHMANTCQLDHQPSQNWRSSHVQWNDGKMDGFVRSDSGPVSMGYWTGDDLPFYYGLTSTFPVCDRWFASVMAQTYPNRRFLLAGTARGNLTTDFGSITDFQPPNGTIMEALGRNAIEWRDYYTDLPTVGLFLPVLEANADKVVKTEQFFADAAAGTLPPFSLVEPKYDDASEENPDDISTGESFVSQVYNAVSTGPGWGKTLLIWLYDEHGGYYDHVAPPPAVAPDEVPPRVGPGDPPGLYDRYGFRVPAAIVSPYARKNYVSSVVHDHTSVLKFLEVKFNLPALTARDGAADALLDALDFSEAAFATPPKLPDPRNPSISVPLCTMPGPIPNPNG
jgi:phospholipase C